MAQQARTIAWQGQQMRELEVLVERTRERQVREAAWAEARVNLADRLTGLRWWERMLVIVRFPRPKVVGS